MKDEESEVQHVPKRPAPEKPPLKVDVCQLVTTILGTHQLVPIFPYLSDGAIVPCLTSVIGHAQSRPTRFFHSNELIETILCIAESGGTIKTGQLVWSPHVHGVTSFLRNPRDPDSYNILLVAIRMKKGPEQKEGIILRCVKCNEIVYERHFNVKKGPERKYYPEFYALRYYAESFLEFNGSENKRTCPKCGVVQPELPVEDVGHTRYARNMETANRARELVESLTSSGGAVNTGTDKT